jgi:FixJ family two-component response regulator
MVPTAQPQTGTIEREAAMMMVLRYSPGSHRPTIDLTGLGSCAMAVTAQRRRKFQWPAKPYQPSTVSALISQALFFERNAVHRKGS